MEIIRREIIEKVAEHVLIINVVALNAGVRICSYRLCVKFCLKFS